MSHWDVGEMTSEHDRAKWMAQAIQLAKENVTSGRGGPFGAVVVKEGRVIGAAANRVTATNDPTAHAEITAIRAACQAIGAFQLEGCDLYTSCEPCPMCLGAIYWARLARFYYACTRESAAEAGFDDAFIYDQLSLRPEGRIIPGYCLLAEEGSAPFVEWARSVNKTPY